MRSYTSTTILALLNFGTAVLSIPVLVVGIWLAKNHPVDCLSFLQWPLIVIGILMLVLSLLGLMGSVRRQASLLWLYIVSLFLLILVLLSFTVFAFIVTRGRHGHEVSGAQFKEYRLEDFSPWLRDQVNPDSNWAKIKLCLQERGVCGDLNTDYPSAADFYGAKISYVESGCCKPPSVCGFKFVTATDWVDASNPGGDVDCSRWSNDPHQLCYDCNSCRAGVLRTVKTDWEKVAKAMVAILVLLVIVYLMAWIVFIRALRERVFSSHASAGSFFSKTRA